MAARICAPCTLCCEATGDLFFPDDRPSPIFSTFSVLINTAFIVLAIVALAMGPCDNDPLLWTILGLCSAAVNIGFAIYLYGRFAYKARHEGVSPGQAACHLFLYDWGVCLYLLFTCWLIAWMVLAGRSWRNSADDDRCGTMCRNGVILFAIYWGVGAFLIFVSIITECCRTPRWRREQSHPASTAPYTNANRRPLTLREHIFGRKEERYPATATPQQEHRPNVVERVIDRVTGHQHQAPTHQQPYQSPAATFAPQPQQAHPYGSYANPPPRNPNYVV